MVSKPALSAITSFLVLYSSCCWCSCSQILWFSHKEVGAPSCFLYHPWECFCRLVRLLPQLFKQLPVQLFHPGRAQLWSKHMFAELPVRGIHPWKQQQLFQVQVSQWSIQPELVVGLGQPPDPWVCPGCPAAPFPVRDWVIENVIAMPLSRFRSI